MILWTKWAFRHPNLQMLGYKLNKLNYFHTLEIVGRGSDQQVQVREN